jgi:hypothetical protein
MVPFRIIPLKQIAFWRKFAGGLCVESFPVSMPPKEPMIDHADY